MYKAIVKISLENIETKDASLKAKDLENKLIKVFTPANVTSTFDVEDIQFEVVSIGANASRQKTATKTIEAPIEQLAA